MAIDFTAAELAQRQREMTHQDSVSSAQLLEEAAARRQAAAEAPGQLAAGATAGIVGAPVDIANVFMKAIGLGSDKPVLGSEWIGEKMRTKTSSMPFQIGTALPLGPDDLAKGMVGMIGMAKSVGKLEDALKMTDKLSDVKRPVPLTEKQFFDKYYQHVSLHDNAPVDEILKEGWKSKIGPNVVKANRGAEDPYATIVTRKFAPKEGNTVFLAPKEWVKDTPNGPKIKDGWKPEPHEIVKVTADSPNMYKEYLRNFEAKYSQPITQPATPRKFDRVSAKALSPAERLALAKEYHTQRTAERVSRTDPMR